MTKSKSPAPQAQPEMAAPPMDGPLPPVIRGFDLAFKTRRTVENPPMVPMTLKVWRMIQSESPDEQCIDNIWDDCELAGFTQHTMYEFDGRNKPAILVREVRRRPQVEIKPTSPSAAFLADMESLQGQGLSEKEASHFAAHEISYCRGDDGFALLWHTFFWNRDQHWAVMLRWLRKARKGSKLVS